MRFAVFLIFISAVFLPAQSDYYPLEDLQPGQKGIWKTVVKGSEIESFELEILGIIPNFIGPGQEAIIAQALDPENVLSGPVAGMSGSPVYIDGKLLGAYAYGYTWAKEQAIIGITPIRDMLTIWDDSSHHTRDYDRPGESGRKPAAALSPSRFSGLRPLPTPLAVSGISERVLAAFEKEMGSRGLQLNPLATAQGTDGEISDAGDKLEPGHAVAAVLMEGDFSAAATGTVTYREGDRLLAFGHPFLNWGEVAVPMAPAEILAVVRNVQLSYKLSRTGQTVGRIGTDTLTGISGTIGPEVPMSAVRVELNRSNGPVQQFQARVFRHERIQPILISMIVAESLNRVMGRSIDRTARVKARFQFENAPNLNFETVATGGAESLQVSFNLLRDLLPLFQHPEKAVVLDSVDLIFDLMPSVRITRLNHLETDREIYRPGDEVNIHLGLQRFRADNRVETLQLRLPAGMQDEDRFEIVVADADYRDKLLGLNESGLRSLDAQIEHWNQRSAPGRVYILLTRLRPSLLLNGEALPRLPDSVLESLSHTHLHNTRMLPAEIIDEVALPVDGVFIGSHPFSLTTEVRP